MSLFLEEVVEEEEVGGTSPGRVLVPASRDAPPDK